jgi:hypothetical protein
VPERDGCPTPQPDEPTVQAILGAIIHVRAELGGVHRFKLGLYLGVDALAELKRSRECFVAQTGSEVEDLEPRSWPTHVDLAAMTVAASAIR